MCRIVGGLERACALALPVVAAILSVTIPAMAASGLAESTPASISPEALMLAEVVILVLAGRLLGEVMQRLGQPSIIGQIIAGVILGPTILGALWPQAEHLLFPKSAEQSAMINGVSQLGILFLLLLAGMETDLGLAYRLRRKAAGVSLAGIAVPFAFGFALGMLVPEAILPDPQKRLVTALFFGTALSISSLKIVATIVREMNFLRRDVGQLIVAAAVIDDTAGWVIIAITLGIATTGSINLPSLAATVIGTVVFLGVSFTIGRRAVFEIIRWTNDNLRSDLPVTTAIVGIMGVMALITAALGVQTVLGAFVAGLLIGQSPILTRQIDEQLRGLTTALFMPVFFGLTGLHTDLRVLADPMTLLLAVVFIAVASVGKFGGAFLGATLNRMSRREALALGFGMNARGSTEVIVATIGLGVGVLDQRLFSVIVTMAVVTTLIMPPTLRWALSNLPMGDEEAQRLKREEFEETSVMANLERLLLVVDTSPAGRLATILSGHIAGLRNMPVTAINLAAGAVSEEETVGVSAVTPQSVTEEVDPAETAAQLRTSSEASIAEAKSSDETRDDMISVEARIAPDDLEATLSDAAAKGHDLLHIGVEPPSTSSHMLDDRIATMLSAFRQTTAIVLARGALRRKPGTRLRILVPLSGGSRSMAALEFAIILAKASGGQLAVLYVKPRSNAGQGANTSPEALFERAREIAENAELSISTVLDGAARPDTAILSRARKGRFNLVVLGVGRRAAEELSFGAVADGLIEGADRSIVFLVVP